MSVGERGDVSGWPKTEVESRHRTFLIPGTDRAAGDRPIAVVMNMFYTGLGIARSLGSRGVSVIGLSSKRGVYGNYTRYAKVNQSPDSREAPEELLAYLLAMGPELGAKGILFPTRDDDLVFLNRYRRELEPYYVPVIPSEGALDTCLDKWETFRCAENAAVSTPRSWRIESPEQLADCLREEIAFPCVLKPLSSYHWRKGRNWERVGSRKAICVASSEELRKEYESIAGAERRALLQELVQGGDDQLLVAACYLDPESRPVASFTCQKLLQSPEGFGTGFIVQTVKKPEILPDAFRLLQAMRFTGIAEVEFKRDSRTQQYKLIEVNPRPWDQHRLGQSCGVDLIYIAYCHAAQIPAPAIEESEFQYKWIAEDVFLANVFRSVWKRDKKLGRLLQSARGRRIYGVWYPRDPFPAVACCISTLTALAVMLLKRVGSSCFRRSYDQRFLKEKHAK